jgi:hypothetical protein
MPDLIPAKDGIVDRHPERRNYEKALDSGSSPELHIGSSLILYIRFSLFAWNDG